MKILNPISILPNAISRSIFVINLFLAALILLSGHALAADPFEVTIKKAEYDAERKKLKVEVALGSRASRTVLLFNDRTDEKLTEKNTPRKSVRIAVQGFTGNDVPCEVRVESGGLSDVSSVANTPADCDVEPTPPPPAENGPECAIIAPGSDVSILLGDSVYFTGETYEPDAGDVLSYEWDFGGGADTRPTTLDAGPVTFDVTNGLFVAELIVTDAAGLRCTSQRLVEVGSPPDGLPPKVSEEPAPGSPEAGNGENVVLAFNDLGMHCADLGSYPFSILPPFNTVNAQVVRKGSRGSNRPLILNDTMVSLQYSAASSANDPVAAGSINSTSQNYPPIPGTTADNAIIRKTDFWDDFDGVNSIAELLFPGLHPVPDEGLQTVANYEEGNAHGRYMPGIGDPYYSNDPQAFSGFDGTKNWFTAQGIPMTSTDDAGRFNSYPLMRVQAVEIGSGEVLATTDAVVPVSTEVDCRDCHALGEVGADPSVRDGGPMFIPAATDDRIDVEAAAKHNILVLHDFQHRTRFVANDQPVLCASCHRSNALAEVGGPGGVSGIGNMSAVMHGYHGRLQVNGTGDLIRDNSGEPVLIDPPDMSGSEMPLIPTGEGIPMEQNCFNCHPGKITQCFRGAMYTAGQKCDDCHGDMLAMGGEFPLTTGHIREPWADEPKCSSCHSGHGDDPIGVLAYDPADPAATPIELADSRFAENPGTLYRNSLDNHAGIACEGCHGSPHAIWPNRDPNANDNVPAIQLQGHAGTIKECTVCHESNSFPNGTLEGPHGMHPVNEPNWIKSKGDFYHEDFVWKNGEDQCAACHGADHRGTRLSRVPVDRVLRDADGVVRATLAAGEIVSCGLCHSIEKSFSD